MSKYIEAILPLPLPGTYTYSIPGTLEDRIAVGCRVSVPLGEKKNYTALVKEIHGREPEEYSVKPIRELLDEEPIVTAGQLRLWDWMSKYYLCSLGEIYKAAVPQGLKGEFKPLTEQRVRLAAKWHNAKSVNLLLQTLSRAPRQKRLLNTFLDLTGTFTTSPTEISKHKLIETAQVAPNIYKELKDKGILETYEVEISRIGNARQPVMPHNVLNPAQQKAFDEIKQGFSEKNVTLLHGVTSAGKTEIYIHLIAEAIGRGEQVLYMLPEIALTKQIVERLRNVFGNRIGLYHSKFTDAERVEIWKKQLSSEPYDVILGVRSSVFLPFKRLGLVVVDEEHENSYKQQEPAPRYHARNVATILAAYHKGKTLLGTATPSIESYYNARCGKYGLAQLTERYSQGQLPAIAVVDLKEEYRKKRMYGPFSTLLHDTMLKALTEGRQVILFQNRRGYAPMLECASCGWVPKCDRCDVSLTYHRGTHQLICHYCGNIYNLPAQCPACGGHTLDKRGMGTERIEEEVQRRFPTARVARLDLDTTRTKSAYDKILSDFQEGRTNVLIGTQMISKGLDFDNVDVVGIMNADTMLNFPDFRSYERSFQLMAQVAGRAGRRGKQGMVVLQTKNADLPVIHQVTVNDYLALYADQVGERELFRYPPFCRLIYIYVKARDEAVATHAAEALAQRLRYYFGERILGPEPPAVARVQSLHIRKLMLKAELSLSVTQVRQCLRAAEQEVASQGLLHGAMIYYDVDPM